MYIEFITGPMFAGKTSRIAKLANESKSAILVSPMIDSRQKDLSYLWTHNGEVRIPPHVSLMRIPPAELLNLNVVGYDTLIITEGQFFGDYLTKFIAAYRNAPQTNSLYCEGLTLDAQGNPFGEMQKIISSNYDIVHVRLRAKCDDCSAAADYTVLRAPQKMTSQILVGANETYKPNCKLCAEKKFE